MDLHALIDQVLEWLVLRATELSFTATVLIVYLLINGLIARRAKSAEKSDARQGAAIKVTNTASLATGFVAILVIAVVWGIELSSVAIFATTTITLLGVALFATWSLLSNITAYFVLLFHPSFASGRFVRIIEADNYVEGYISDLSLFSLELVAEDKSTIVYPNNLLLGRIAIIDPPDRLNGVGKIVNPPI
jgi:small-conductance mechanosensitive channel